MTFWELLPQAFILSAITVSHLLSLATTGLTGLLFSKHNKVNLIHLPKILMEVKILQYRKGIGIKDITTWRLAVWPIFAMSLFDSLVCHDCQGSCYYSQCPVLRALFSGPLYSYPRPTVTARGILKNYLH